MNEPVYILGAGRTDFKRNLKKEGKALRDVIVEAGQKAIAEANQPKKLTFEVNDEGIYGITLVAKSGVGLGERAPQLGDRPQCGMIGLGQQRL